MAQQLNVSLPTQIFGVEEATDYMAIHKERGEILQYATELSRLYNAA